MGGQNSVGHRKGCFVVEAWRGEQGAKGAQVRSITDLGPLCLQPRM